MNGDCAGVACYKCTTRSESTVVPGPVWCSEIIYPVLIMYLVAGPVWCSEIIYPVLVMYLVPAGPVWCSGNIYPVLSRCL